MCKIVEDYVKEEMLEFVKGLLLNGVGVDLIVQSSQLSYEEVESIQQELIASGKISE